MDFEDMQAYKMLETGVLVWISKNNELYINQVLTLVARCLNLNDQLLCLKAFLNLKAK